MQTNIETAERNTLMYSCMQITHDKLEKDFEELKKVLVNHPYEKDDVYEKIIAGMIEKCFKTLKINEAKEVLIVF